MQKIGRLFSILVLLLFFPWLASADVKVEIQVDRNRMNVGDTFTAVVSVVSDQTVNISEPRVPNLNGFELINAWTTKSSSQKMVQTAKGLNFVMIRKQSFLYMLAAQKEGRLSLEAFDVNVDGQIYRTQPVIINVGSSFSGSGNTGGAPQVQEEEDEADALFNQLLQNRLQKQAPAFRTLPENMNEAFFIQVELDKTEAFVGEQIIARWYIYTRGVLEQLDRIKFPNLKGFWKEDIDPAPVIQYTDEVVNGVPFRKALIAAYALFPMKEGSAIVDEYKLRCSVRLSGTMGFGQAYQYTKSSKPIKINIKPLPTEGRPQDYSGAMGIFNVSTQVEGSPFYVNQPFSFKVRFEGIGNAKLIDLPEIQWPNGLELYDTKKEASYQKTGHSFKEFEILLIPRVEGEVSLPAISVSMFDPAKNEYVRKTTQPMKIKVLPDKGGGQGQSFLSNTTKANETPALKPREEVLPDVALTWRSGFNFSFMQRMTIWGGVYLFIFLVIYLKARRELNWGQRRHSIKNKVTKRFKKVYDKVGSGHWREAATEVMNIVYFTLGEVSGLGGAHTQLEKIFEAASPSLRRELQTPITEVMKSLEILSFAPEEIIGDLKDKKKVKEIIQKMEKLMYKSISLSDGKGD